jgi:hypothetical protein
MSEHKDLSEGGVGSRGSALDGPNDDPALEGNERQAVKNQGKTQPDEYPERHEQN